MSGIMCGMISLEKVHMAIYYDMKAKTHNTLTVHITVAPNP
jgi:hypothetical protein